MLSCLLPTRSNDARKRKALLSVYVAVVIDWMGVSLTQPIMPFYITDVLSGPSWSVGLLYAIFATVQIVGTPLLGWASDKYGRRPVMLISLAGTCGGYTLSAAALDYRLLLAARGLQGFFSSSLSVANAYIADIFPQDERPALMATLRGLGSATYIIMPTIGSLLSLYSMRAPYLAGASTSAIACGIAFVFMPSPQAFIATPTSSPAPAALEAAKEANNGGAVDEDEPPSARAWHHTVAFIGLINVFMSFAVAAAMFGVALYLKATLDWDQVQVAVIMTTSSILGLLLQFGGFDMLQRRIGLLRVGTLSGISLSFAYLLLTAVRAPITSTTYVLVSVVTLLQGAGIAISMAVPSPLLAQYATSKTMGRMMAYATTTGTIGRVVGPVSLGLLFEFGGPSLPLLVTAACCLLGAIGYYGVQLAEASAEVPAADDDYRPLAESSTSSRK